VEGSVNLDEVGRELSLPPSQPAFGLVFGDRPVVECVG